MKIRLRLSGGFAGQVREARVDLTDRPGTEPASLDAAARRLWSGLRAAQAASAPGPAAAGSARAEPAGALRDVEYCEIELQEAGSTACLAAPVPRLDADARLVLAQLRPLSRPVPPA